MNKNAPDLACSIGVLIFILPTFSTLAATLFSSGEKGDQFHLMKTNGTSTQ